MIENLPRSTGQATKTQPKQDTFSLSHFSSFLTIYLLFKCRSVAWQRGFPRRFAYCVSVSHISVRLNLFVFGSLPSLSVSTPPSPPTPHPLQTHTTVAAFVVAGDNMCRWATMCVVNPGICCRRRQNVPWTLTYNYIVAGDKICPATKYAARSKV